MVFSPQQICFPNNKKHYIFVLSDFFKDMFKPIDSCPTKVGRKVPVFELGWKTLDGKERGICCSSLAVSGRIGTICWLSRIYFVFTHK